MNPESSPARGGVKVDIRSLRKSFAGREVLQGIDLQVARGEIFVIMGPSGSGKSVLLRHVIGLETPDSGEILIENEPIHGSGLQDRYRLAMVFQSSALLNSLSVGENVGLYLAEHRLKSPEEIDRIVAEKLELVGLPGLESRTTAELSGGMRKRVAIARALAVEPQLILFDEPTSELDPLSAVAVAEEILKLKRRLSVTSLVVTHDRDLAFGVADRVAMIHQGKILQVGLPDAIRRSDDALIRRFLAADFNVASPPTAHPSL
jgi:phospholipid/cholesterol/gamma-HCH transport system ATP-binding protein